MKRFFNDIYIFAFLFFSLTSFLFSQNKIIEPQFRKQPLPFGLEKEALKQKPKVAFVFSGGGSRGAAQVGVLRALLENNIYPDLIVGTSIGSIVGGLFASGYSIDDLDTIIKNTNWDEILTSNDRGRNNLFVEQKLVEDKNLLTFRLEGLSPVIPTSISDGAKILNFLNILTLHAPVYSQDFDRLRVPFRAVCTDLISGMPVVLGKGDLAEVMRASSSVSFLLDPIEIDTFLLADGGMVSNIPVLIAKKSGADFVIAINTTSPLRVMEQLDKVWYLADQVVSIPMKQLENIDLSNAEAVIEPMLNHSSTDFSGLDTLIELGYKEALKQIPEIKEKLGRKYSNSFLNDFTYFNNFSIDNAGDYENFLTVQKYSKKEKVGRKEIIEWINKLSADCNCYPQLDVKQGKDSTHAILRLHRQNTVKEIYLNRIGLNDYSFEKKFFLEFVNKPFNPSGLADSVISLIRYYKQIEKRMINCKTITFSDTTGRIDINLSSDFADEIKISGNFKTKSEIIDREIPFNSGEQITIQNIQKSFDNINSTNLFELSSVFMTYEESKNILTYKVKEKNSGLIRIGMRADNERGLQLAADVREENFLGRATEIGAYFTGGLRSRTFGLENLSNRIFNTFLSYKFKAYYELTDKYIYANSPEIYPQNWDRIKVGEFKNINYGLKFSVGTQIEKLGNIYIELNRFKSEFIPLSGTIENELNFNLFTFRFGALFDSRNIFPFPTDGILMDSYFETSLRIIGGEMGYSKIYFKYESFISYFGNHTFHPRLIFGYGDETLPLSEQFFIGGQNSFLGLREDDLVGRQIFLASLEYRIKLPFKLFFDTYIYLRYDLGGAWQTPAAIRYIELRHGIGGGIGFDTPIGAANFSVGRGFFIRNDILKKPLSFGPFLFYFELGYPL